jgi:hypothetical protein
MFVLGTRGPRGDTVDPDANGVPLHEERHPDGCFQTGKALGPSMQGRAGAFSPRHPICVERSGASTSGNWCVHGEAVEKTVVEAVGNKKC